MSRTKVQSGNSVEERAQAAKDANRCLRYWKFLLYPDSCGGGWVNDVEYDGLLDRLEELNVQLFCSPIHNRDLDASGNYKKPHMHVLCYVPGKKSYRQMLELLTGFGVNIVIPVDDHEVDEQYWCHLNCRNKTAKPEYPVEDCVSLNGYTPTGLLKERHHSALAQLWRLVEDNGIIYFCDLMNEVMTNWPNLIEDLNRYMGLLDKYLLSRERIVRMVKASNAGIDPDNPSYVKFNDYSSYRIKFGGSGDNE